MINDIIREMKHLKTDRKTLKKFCITFWIILCIIAAVLYFKGNASAVYFVYTGFAFLILGIIRPEIVRFFYLFWMGLSFVLGWFMSRIILSITFFLVLRKILTSIFLERRSRS